MKTLLAVLVLLFQGAMITPQPHTLTNITIPFDVPPKEWDGPDKHYEMNCTPLKGTGFSNCFDDMLVPDHHRSCEDKSRFLLMSEDKVWHCLKFEGATP